MSHIYPAQLDPEEDGGYVVTLPDIGCRATQGDTFEEALRQAEDMLGEASLGMIAHSEEVPLPSPAKGRPVVRLPALTAAKLGLYRAMREAGLDAAQLADRLGWPLKKVAHIFDGRGVAPLWQTWARSMDAGSSLSKRIQGATEAADNLTLLFGWWRRDSDIVQDFKIDVLLGSRQCICFRARLNSLDPHMDEVYIDASIRDKTGLNKGHVPAVQARIITGSVLRFTSAKHAELTKASPCPTLRQFCQSGSVER